MRVFESLSMFFAEEKPSSPILTIGNFDGLHKGHQSLLDAAKKMAQQENASWGGLTFSPHPRAFFTKKPSASLFLMPHKIEAFAKCGASFLVVQPFNEAFSQISPASFLATLKGCGGIVVGEDFRFGKERRGDKKALGSYCLENGLLFSPMEPVSLGGVVISSSRIRKQIEAGRLLEAGQLLGRPYMLEGTIREGKKLGRTLGFPTLNLAPAGQLKPLSGVYSGWIYLEGAGECFGAVINVGKNPTTARLKLEKNPDEQKIEGHILARKLGENSYYGKKARFYFYDRVRDERSFEGLKTLKEQVTKDMVAAGRHIQGKKPPLAGAF